MLKCNLAVLLAERNVRISKVSSDTGISRTTLTSLSNNYSQGIQLDTLNKLCLYLQCPPEKFFAYLPFDYALRVEFQNDQLFTVEFFFSSKGKSAKAVMLAYIDADIETTLLDDDAGAAGKIVHGLTVDLELDGDCPEDNTVLIKYLGGIPAIFKKDMEEKILEAIYDSLKDVDTDDVSFALSWPDELS